MDIGENVRAILGELQRGNGAGEAVTLVAATKTRSVEEICAAVEAGVTDIGENRVQELRQKHGRVGGAREHFIGHLQTNKVKYAVGCTLIHSLDRDELAAALSAEAAKRHIVQDVLIQINIGREPTKGGYSPGEAMRAYERLSQTEGLRVRGFMAMLPPTDDEVLLASLAKRMRALYDEARAADGRISFLSMGMSGDWRLCVREGANMIRLGTAIFGERT